MSYQKNKTKKIIFQICSINMFYKCHSSYTTIYTLIQPIKAQAISYHLLSTKIMAPTYTNIS